MVQETEEVKRRSRNRHGVPRPVAGHLAEVPRPLQQRESDRLENRDAAQPDDGPPQLRCARLRRRGLRRLRRKKRPARHRRGHRGVPEADLPREGPAAAPGGRRARCPGRRASGGTGRPRSRAAQAVRARRGPHPDGARRRHRRGHDGAARGPRPDLERGCRRRRHRHHAAGGLQPPGSAGARREAAERPVRHGDGRAHRLQHGVRLHPAEQPAPLSLDELAVPGRLDDRLVDRRELHRGPRPPVGDSRTSRDLAPRARGRRHRRAALLRVHPFLRQPDDRRGDRRDAAGLDRRRRRRDGGHRLPERLEDDSAESAEREGADARHAGLFEHRRPELGFDPDARRRRHERVSGRPARASASRRRRSPRRSSRATDRPSSPRSPSPTRPSCSGPSSTRSTTAAPRSCSASPPASPSTASATTWPSTRRSGSATRAAPPSSSSTPGWARPTRRRST